MSQKLYVKTFHCDPAQACYCNSLRPFGECCAAPRADRKPPHGIFIEPNCLSQADCRRLVRFAQKQNAKWLMTRDPEKSTPTRFVEKRDSGRVTQQVDMGKHQDYLDAIVRRALVDVAFQKMGIADFFEPPYLLRYRVGGKYGMHADAEIYDAEKGLFYRVADRDVSLLIYFNDDFEGGELTFNRLNYTYRPVAGDLVMFPSTNLYMHQAEPVTRGNKYALVSWASLKGSEKLFPGASRWPPLKV
jgi:predicted 2-oxoglutarate/Fe(II)-dependent dioxygenase YbiX